MVGYFLKKQTLLFNVGVVLLLFICLFFPVLAGAQDSIHSDIPVQDGEMDTFLFMFALCAIFLMGLIFIITVCLVFFSILTMLGMISAGVLASSVFVGMYKKSWTAGFKTAWYIIVMLLSSFTAVAGFGILSYFFNLHASKPTTLMMGLLIGLLGGAFIAWISIKFLRFLIQYFQEKITSYITSNSTTDLDNP